MPNKKMMMDPNRLKNARADLWPVFLQILKEDNLKFHEMIINNSTINTLMEKLNGKLMINVNDLPERAKQLIKKASKEAIERAKNNG